jgi:biotin synthase
VGLGETEKDMVEAFQKVSDFGGVNHLFSFYPEEGSALSEMNQPPMDNYRRIQIACELIDSNLSNADKFKYDKNDRIIYYGVPDNILENLINSGKPFETRGCLGDNGKVACNRPYANSLPGDNIRNFPFAPNEDDIARIKSQLRGEI